MAREDQEDEFFEKEIDDVIPVGFHIVGEDDEDEEGVEKDSIDDSDDEDDDDELIIAVEIDDDEDEVAGDFGGKDFDFEHEEDES